MVGTRQWRVLLLVLLTAAPGEPAQLSCQQCGRSAQSRLDRVRGGAQEATGPGYAWQPPASSQHGQHGGWRSAVHSGGSAPCGVRVRRMPWVDGALVRPTMRMRWHARGGGADGEAPGLRREREA